MAEQFLTLMADLDDDAQALLSGWYSTLRIHGFTGSQTPGLPYHISLASYSPEREREIAELAEKAAGMFSAFPVHISHMGIFSGGKVLFAAPERNAELNALREACEKKPDEEYPWTPHITMLIDEPDTICAALPELIRSFRPFTAQVTRLHLCAFRPTREILSVALAGGRQIPVDREP